MTQRLLTLIFIIFSCLFTFCYYKFLLPTGIGSVLQLSVYSILRFSLFYCQSSMCWVSKLLLLSYYCGNVCLSGQIWPLPGPEPGTAVVFFCPQSPLTIRNIFPFTGEKNLWQSPPLGPLHWPLVCDDVWSQWVIGTTCYGMRVATL